MNRIINNYGAVNQNSPVALAVDALMDSISIAINDIVRSNKLTPEEIICLENKAAGAVTATCAVNILRAGIAMRKAERETIEVAAAKVVEFANQTLKTKRVSAKRDIRTPTQWCEFFGVEVIDPDGWRGTAPSWNTPITRDMFKVRYQASTVRTVDKEKFAQWKHYLEGN